MSRRGREDAGKSEASWIKHEVLYKVAFGQASAWRATHPLGRMVVVDMNAGDGVGVARPQLDMWSDNPSKPTPVTATEIATRLSATVVLCECDEARRGLLIEPFPAAIVLADHSLASDYIASFDYALVISDPCGPRDHGVKYLQAIAKTARYADFAIVWDEQFITRLEGVAASNGGDTPQRRGWLTSLERYGPMNEPPWWCQTLERRHVARTKLVKASPGFHWRIFVVANYLSQAAQRGLFEVIQ